MKQPYLDYLVEAFLIVMFMFGTYLICHHPDITLGIK